ncbi:MAG: helix-turn-helix domain-containing protein [Bdellovibrionota bacterium]
METRTCACGCGQTFRVANISNQRYASLEHEALVTPGGMNEVRKRTAKKAARARLIPKDATGQVGSMELAKILGISYQTLFHWMKSGKIRPLSGTERNKVFDIAQVRIQLGQETGEPEAAAPALEATDASLSERIEALPEYEPAPEETTEPTEPTSEESEPEHEETEMTQEHVEENTEELLSASEAAAELGISVASVYNWTKSGRLIGTAVGNKTQFSAAAVAAAKSAEEKSEEAPAKALAPKRVKKMRRKKKTAEIGILVRFKMSAGDYLYRNRNLFLGTMIGVGVTRLFMMMHH